MCVAKEIEMVEGEGEGRGSRVEGRDVLYNKTFPKGFFKNG